MQINVNTAKALLLTAGKKDKRFYLNGVFITRSANGRALAISTDGHRGLIVELPTNAPEWALAIIPRAELETAVKAEKGADLEINRESIRGSNGATFLYAAVDGKYPNVALILPDHTENNGPALGFNADYIADFAKVAKLLTDRKAAGFCISYPDPKSSKGAALITFSVENAIGIIMPLRDSTARVNVGDFNPG